MSDEALPDPVRRRGRWLAIASHPFSMTFRVTHLRDLGTQALLTLGAAEAVVGLHAALSPLATILQLPSLGLMNRVGKRRLLLVTQVLALVAALPLLWFADLRALGPEASVPIAMTCMALTIVALSVGSTAWWPLLHGFVTERRTSRFFGVMRTSWHLGLVVFFGFCTWWLDGNPAAFGALFAVAWACGLIRVFLLSFFPERPESEPYKIREALSLLRSQPALRRYLFGVSLDAVVVRIVTTFTIVLLRREMQASEAETFAMTLAFFFGGMLALYPAGRLADRLGARPILLGTYFLRGLLIAGLAATAAFGGKALGAVVGLSFAYSMLNAAFGVAEVKTLFGLAPEDSPSAVIVCAVVVRHVAASGAPLVAGIAIQGLGDVFASSALYGALFLVAAVIQIAAMVPLAKITR